MVLVKIFVTGGTGYVGRGILARLVERGHQVVALVRSSGRLEVGELEWVEGDVLDTSTFESQLQDCDACVHLVGILREYPDRGITFDKLNYQATVNMLRACGKVGVQRFLHMSANGAERGLATGYMTSKAKAEEAVRASPLRSTIFRPSLVYAGPENRNHFVGVLEEMMSNFPVMAYFGTGDYRQAPVSADNVAEAFANALEDSTTLGGAYHLCGSDTLRYREVLEKIRDSGRFSCRFFSLPLWLGRTAVEFLGKFDWFPLTEDMLGLLAAENTFPEGAKGLADLGIQADSFDSWLRQRGGLDEDPGWASAPSGARLPPGC